MSLEVAELMVSGRELFLYMMGGDFAEGQREIPITWVPLVIGRFSEGQER